MKSPRAGIVNVSTSLLRNSVANCLFLNNFYLQNHMRHSVVRNILIEFCAIILYFSFNF